VGLVRILRNSHKDEPGTRNVFAGLMDEMAIYSRALSASEIAALCQAVGREPALPPGPA
jgi:hypothetical protein